MTQRRHVSVLIGAAVLLAAACGPKRSETLQQPITSIPTSIPSATSPSVTQTVPELASGPGVTNTEVKIGFVIVDQKGLEALLGVDSPESGDTEGQINALVAFANNNGGVAGRQIVPVIKVYDALRDTPTKEEELCRQFTEDDGVFAVVLLGQFQPNARSCYADQRTLMIDQTLYPVDSAGFAELAPYLWQPALPEYGKLFRGLAVALVEEDFLGAGTKLGVVGIDTPINRAVFNDSLLPMLAELKVQPTKVNWVDPTSNATLQAGQNETILSFKGAGVDRVVVVGGSRLLAFLLTIAIPQQYFPKYAVTSFDNPDYNVRETPEAMVGAVGISVQPGFDIADGQIPFPNTPGEQRCIQVLADAGHTFAARDNARQATLYCDAVFILKDATAGIDGSLTAETFAAGVAAMGNSWQGASNYSAGFSSGNFDGATGYRVMAFDETCTCFKLLGETREFK